VVFVRELQLGGQPNTIGVWVYGDGSGHYVNSWIKDAQGEIWSVHLGKVGGSGWRQLAGRVDSERGWPSGHVAGPENGAVDYPIRFHALVLDRVGAGPTSGRIYVDDISVWQSEAGTTGTPEAATTATSATGEPTPEATSEAPVSEGPLDFPRPTQLDAWEGVEDGHRVTIVVHITGGAPPFTIYHDGVEIETTQERDYPLVFTVGGCTLTHTITVESADGQSVSHDYFIRGPWCD
jgi:hypothetical protein